MDGSLTGKIVETAVKGDSIHNRYSQQKQSTGLDWLLIRIIITKIIYIYNN